MGLRHVAPGIEVDEDSILSIQEIEGATVIRLKDGGVITAPSLRHRMNLGEMMVYNIAAKRINKLPQYDPSQPFGLRPMPYPMPMGEMSRIIGASVREAFAALDLTPNLAKQ